jgi:uncharacterized protein YeaO (DUF488 family)
MIRAKRVYDPLEPDDGARLLVDRLWPRGVKKEQLSLDGWHRDIAPSSELRKWFGHDPTRWEEFKRRYFVELDKKPEAYSPLLEAVHAGNTTLLYSAQDREHNNAVALKTYLEAKLQE